MSWTRVTALVATALLTAAPAAQADVRWRSGGTAVVQAMPVPQRVEEIGRLSARPDRQRVVIHLDGPLDTELRAELASSGVVLLAYLGDHAYFARLIPNLDISRVATNARVTAVQAIETVRKLHPDLAAGIVRPWSIIGGAGEAPAGKRDAERPNPMVAAYVMFHPDVDLLEQGARVVGRHGGIVRSWLRSINGAVVHLRADGILGLAAEDDVMYVEPPLPRFGVINDGNRPRVGADVLQAQPYGLDGTDVNVLVYDGGRMFAHADFGDRLTIGSSDTAGISDHATHVGGTIGGDGSSSGGQFRGMAPGVGLVSYGFEQEGGLQQGFLYTDPGDLESDYTEAITVHGADLSNNSIGTNTASNGFPCEWEGNYGATDALIDAVAAGSTGGPFRIVWANGNERSTGACGTTYHTTAPPACAKGHITIGALNSDDDSVTDFTSWGPCDDGRMKPDVSAPGCQNGGDGGVTSTSSSGGYNVKCGTSMASPTVAGVAALLLQQYRIHFPGEPDFRNSTLKTILAHTAQDIETVGPDFKTGYGSVRAVPAATLIAEGRFLEADVGQGETYSFVISVGPGTPEVKATLAWDDPPGTPNVDPVLVNDLDLRVIGPDDTAYLPWTLDAANPSAPAVRTQRNGLDNIEQVVINLPLPGVYRVEIEGFNVAQGPRQAFSATASPTLFNCSSEGSLSADKASVTCESQFTMRVIDCDLDLDPEAVESVAVTVVSDSDSVGETVTLNETAAASAQFENALTVSQTGASAVLEVSEGDTITVTYTDADDGVGGTNVGVNATLVVDCTAPTTTGVSLVEILPREATAGISLDEESVVTLHYGTACEALTSSAGSLQRSDSHEIRMRPLQDATTYFFDVAAADEAGNGSVDDNGGSCYSFTTPEVPDFFTEQFSGGLDIEGLSLTFQPNGSNDFYALCDKSGVTAFPTDPSNGTDLNLGDDQPSSFALGAGAQAMLYGQAASTIFVGPNGYLTFGSGDSDYTETLQEHFGLPRVAALWDDINPGAGGSVSWKQLADRVAVTWENVPEYNTSNSNSFQIEMFFDGRIRMTWLNVELSDALIGLSAGSGLDPDFLATDLSAAGFCEPLPPVATDMSLLTHVDTPLGITLDAEDDGEPVPGSLSWRIVRLPSYGTLVDDIAGAPITAVPYALASGGNGVTYTPSPGISGTDYFDFLADDGGAAPQGGASNIATVAIHIEIAPLVYHEFLVDSDDPDWIRTGAWAFGFPTGGGSHDGDPTSGATGNRVYGYNLGGDYADNMGIETLTTLPMDLSGATDTELEFQRWLGVDAATFDHASIQVTTNGFSWITIWQNTGDAISESDWSRQRIDISSIADNHSLVSLRWRMGTTNGSVTYPGWNIDDIRIQQATPTVCFDAPLEVSGVELLQDKGTLTWDAAAHAGGVVPGYDVLRSTDAMDFGSATCIESADASDTQATDGETAPPGGVYFYLIRAANDCGAGSLGQDSSGTERTAGQCSEP